jgi:hypothetical protein
MDSQTLVRLLTPAGRTACVQIRVASLSNRGRLDSASERLRHKNTGIEPVLFEGGPKGWIRLPLAAWAFA